MKAWWVDRPGPITGVASPLAFGDRPEPQPGPGEIAVDVSACGVCRTDLHLAEGDLAPHRYAVTPGHEVVGVVADTGLGAGRFAIGDRVGIAWLRGTCGRCAYCHGGRENLCVAPRFTGWDADGGFAERAVVDERFAYPLPVELPDDQAAPLLCAGIIGYRALKLAAPPPGGRIGLYGFGASAHLVAQLALRQGLRVHVLTRSAAGRRLALDLGADSAGDAADPPPEPLDAAILFAPAGGLVPPALEALAPGGVLAVAGIHLSDVPVLDYQRHLFGERVLRSVTANTRQDGEELLRLAVRVGLRAATTVYPLAEADVALRDLATDALTGVAVLKVR